MRFQKEILALARKMAKAEFDFAREMYRNDKEAWLEEGTTERQFVKESEEHVCTLIYEEVSDNLSAVAVEEYLKLFKAKYKR